MILINSQGGSKTPVYTTKEVRNSNSSVVLLYSCEDCTEFVTYILFDGGEIGRDLFFFVLLFVIMKRVSERL